jgi:hypothetical protein
MATEHRTRSEPGVRNSEVRSADRLQKPRGGTQEEL